MTTQTITNVFDAEMAERRHQYRQSLHDRVIAKGMLPSSRVLVGHTSDGMEVWRNTLNGCYYQATHLEGGPWLEIRATLYDLSKIVLA